MSELIPVNPSLAYEFSIYIKSTVRSNQWFYQSSVDVFVTRAETLITILDIMPMTQTNSQSPVHGATLISKKQTMTNILGSVGMVTYCHITYLIQIKTEKQIVSLTIAMELTGCGPQMPTTLESGLVVAMAMDRT
jgi:hypothetical protein